MTDEEYNQRVEKFEDALKSRLLPFGFSVIRIGMPNEGLFRFETEFFVAANCRHRGRTVRVQLYLDNSQIIHEVCPDAWAEFQAKTLVVQAMELFAK